MTRGMTLPRAVLIAIFLTLAPEAAQAHLVETGLGPVYDGVAHLALSPEQWVPLVGAALYAGLGGKASARRAIVVLPLAWLSGTLLGGLSGAPSLNAPTWLILMLVGGLIAGGVPLPGPANALFAGALGLIVGYSNGLATAQFAQPTRAALGATAAIFVAASLAAAAASAASGWTRIAVRVAGSWIAASALLLLGWTLRQGV